MSDVDYKEVLFNVLEFGHKGTDNAARHQTDISHIVTNLSEKQATGDSSIP